MAAGRSKSEHDLYRKIKWLIFFRTLFAGVLLGSVVIAAVRPDTNLVLLGQPFSNLMLLAGIMLIFSIGYSVFLPRVKRLVAFAYVQTGLDTFFVTLVIFITGSSSSVFSFLYLVVIIYATMVIYRRGGMVIATMCVLQYGVLIDLEFFRIIQPIGFDGSDTMIRHDWQYVVFKLVITFGACYAVAFLSGFLAEQERNAKQELWDIEDQMKRVERLAAVGEMAAGLTHEIKNPLASLIGSIQMLRESIPYDPDHDKLMQIILREADRLSSLVTEFLMFARPQTGKIQEVRLDRAIEEVVSLFTADPAYSDRISVHTDLKRPISVDIDPKHLKQVIWNLLNNAAEAVADRGRIDISLHPVRKTFASITVADNGCGISEDAAKFIFDPFYSTKPRGTGLGLSIVHQIVGSYGGLIDVDSKPGRGTRVTIRLKRHPSAT